MFNRRKKTNHEELIKLNKENYLQILYKILEIVDEKKFWYQNKIIKELIVLLDLQKIDDFKKSLNSVDIWGGAGAVWEIHIDNKSNAIKFEQEMINLIDLMEKTKNISKGIKPIRKIFRDNQISQF